MAKKVQLQTNGKEWQVVDGEQVLVDVPKQDIDPITSSSCVQIEGFRTLEEAVSDNKMLSQDLTYTKVMDKVGGDYHQNVLDGQYSKAILYGNTQVNLCEEDSSVALQIPTTFTSFNNGELQVNNKENQVVAPLIKGVTMVNLAQTDSSSITSGNGLPIHNVKGNTLYTLSFKFTTKNTNSGVVIQSYDANGTYLENTMHKTGLGDDVKFTFTTHANATKVHICNNAAYGGETIQLDEIMLIEGDQTALDIPFFKGMKSVELVRPLTNLFDNNTPTNHSWTGVTNVDGTVTATSQTSGTWTYARFNITFKPNTSYVVMWDSLTYTQTGNANQTIAICYGDDIIANIDNNFTNKRSIIFNTGDRNPSDINLRIHATTKNTETGTTTVTGLRVFEYDDYLRSIDLQSIGYFSGTKNVAVEPVKTCSKNLYPCGDISYTSHLTNVDVWFDAKGTSHMHGDVAQKSRARFLLKKGTYTITTREWVNASACQIVDDKEQIIVKLDSGKRNHTFTLLQDTYCTLRFKVIELEVWANIKNIQIERGETATDYVAYDTIYYEPDGQNTIVLRSLPNGVCDTFNLQTGEYVQRINEVVFDGSEEWSQNGNGSYGFFTTRQDSKPSSTIVCDKLKEITGWNNYSEKGIFRGTQAFGIVLTSNELTTCNVETFRQWLQQNPLTVQYQLATPITTIIPRTIKRNNNGTVSTIDFKTYTNKENLRLPSNPTFLTINSMTSIKPVVEPITYIDFKTRLKANTDYTIKLNKETNAFVTTNLGGTSVVFNTGDTQKFVKTPSVNLGQNLRISGSGTIQNIMVIEGDVLDKELPYFNGMCNVKMPIVRNSGKNLVDFDRDKTNWWVNNEELSKGDDTGLYYSVMIKASGGNRYKIAMKNTDRSHYGFLDEDFNILVLNANNRDTVVAPKNTKYLIWYLSSTGLTSENNVQIELVENNNLIPTSYEPYRGNDICLVQGEIGLSKDMFEQGGFSGDSGNTYDNCKASTNTNIRMRTKGLITVKPNTTYIVNNNTSPNMNHVFYLFDESQKYLGSNIAVNAKSFVTPNNCRYVSLMLSKNSDANISVSEFKQDYFQLLELDSTVQLRSLPNGVKDELNLLTGEYIQRVGEVVLDGSENEGWNIGASSNANLLDFYIHNIIPNALNNGDGISDKFNYINQVWDVKVAGICVNLDKGISMMLPTKYVKTQDLQGCLEWLQSNPITVQYELAEPIISYPRIVSNTQERELGVKLPRGQVNTYNPSTGITTVRVGKVVLDGSEDWYFDTTKANTQVFGLRMSDIATTQNNLYCETMRVASGVDAEIIATAGGVLFIALLKTKASTVDELKTYLASNPVTVWYELKNPIVTTDIVLPNGVHDEYNPLTGLYTKRVGFVELDGSDDEGWSPTLGTGNSTHCYASISIDGTISPEMKYMANHDEVYIMSDKFETVPRSNFSYDREQLYVWSVRTVYLNILQSRLSTLDIDGFRQYLSQNPIKVWYELSTPITYQLTPYFGLPMPYAYKDGYLIMDSAYDGQSLPPEITYQLTVNRTGQITQNNIKLKEHTARLSNLEYILIEATLDSIFSREMQNFELELMNIKLLDLDE